MKRSYCFHCGKEIAPNTIPAICARCQSHGDLGERGTRRYALKFRDGQSRSNLSHQEIVHLLERNGVEQEDRVSLAGSPFSRLDQHTDFRAYFVPGSAQESELKKVRRDMRRRQSSRKRRMLAKTGMAIAAAFGGLGFATWAASTGATVVPPEVLEAVNRVVDDGLKIVARAIDEDVARQELHDSMEAPGKQLLADLTILWPHPEGMAAPRIQDGWADLQSGTRAGRESARVHFEQAVVLAPDDASALAGLALTYAWMGIRDSDLNRAVVTLMERAQFVSGGNALTRRAQAGIAMSSRSWELARASASECLRETPKDVYCSWFLAEAEVGLKNYKEAASTLARARETTPSASGIVLAQARAALAARDMLDATGHIESFLAQHPGEPEAHVVQARIHRNTGQFTLALEAALRAMEFDSEALEARHLAGVLHLYVKENCSAALAILAPLAEHPSLAHLASHREILVHTSHAARCVGKLDDALTYAERSLQGVGSYAPGRFAAARVYRQRADHAGVETALRMSDPSGLGARHEARFASWTGQYHIDRNRGQAARQEFSQAVQLAPGWARARFFLASAYLESGDVSNAMEQISRGYDQDIRRVHRLDPVDLLGPPDTSDFTLSTRALEVLQRDPRMSRQLSRALGVVGAAACVEGAKKRCGPARFELMKALTYDDGDVTSHAWLAHLAHERESWADVEKHLSVALGSTEQSPLLTAIRARALYGLKRTDDGDELFAKAIRSDEQNPAIHILRGEALLSARRPAEALAAFRRASTLDPEDVTTRGRILAIEQQNE